MENVNGTWKNAKKVSVAPKYASAKHPAVSADGKRLFFASNMRGSYGKYDIYVAEISSNGDAGVAKNLGPKVNTKEDELYPNLHNGTLLFFASAGRKGYGGLDLYATQVTRRNLTASVNLGSHINSKKDDYSTVKISKRKLWSLTEKTNWMNYWTTIPHWNIPVLLLTSKNPTYRTRQKCTGLQLNRSAPGGLFDNHIA